MLCQVIHYPLLRFILANAGRLKFGLRRERSAPLHFRYEGGFNQEVFG